MGYPPQKLTNIPVERVAKIMDSFRRDGAIKIIQQPMPDGTWVVTAEFAADPAEHNAWLKAAATATQRMTE
ncbi:MAG: hypothetical protein EXR08_11910 [Alphaproteobacteria bacterium]|nr:hypothetical protein [Alphaproteobacteria bacterium]